MFIDRDMPEEHNYFHPEEHNNIFYDDETVFTFNHPKRNNLAAIQKTEELNEDADAIMAEQFKKYKLEELTEEQMATMKQEDIDLHNKRRQQMMGLNEQIRR